MSVKFLHGLNCFLWFVNAIMWATVAHMPWIAVGYGIVAVGELFYIRYLNDQGAWSLAQARRRRA